MGDMKEQKTSRLQFSLKIVVSAGLMVWLIAMIDWNEALQVVKEGSPFYIIAAFLAIQLTVSTSIWKWKLLVESADKTNHSSIPSIGKLGKLYYIGLFFNNFLPGSVGGDVMRIFYLGKMTKVSSATASVLFERLTSGGALVAIVLISALFIDNVGPYLLSLFLLVAVAVTAYILFKYWMKKDKEAKFSQSSSSSVGKVYELFNKGKKSIAAVVETAGNYRNEGLMWWGRVVILSLLFQVGMAWINDLLFLSFGIDVPFLHLLVIITLISVITMIPVSLNGLGVREAGYVFFFQALGVPEGIALSVSLLFFFLVTVSSVIGGLFWLAERRKRYYEIIG